MPKLRVATADVRDYDLHCYAPGDGALAFSWVNRTNGQADSYLIVTREDVDAYLAGWKGKGYADKNYKVATINGELRLHQPVTRIDAGTLELDGHRYQYALSDEGKRVLAEDHRVIDGYLTLTFDDEGTPRELKNWSIRATLRFFLTHEAKLEAA